MIRDSKSSKKKEKMGPSRQPLRLVVLRVTVGEIQ